MKPSRTFTEGCIAFGLFFVLIAALAIAIDLKLDRVARSEWAMDCLKRGNTIGYCQTGARVIFK